MDAPVTCMHDRKCHDPFCVEDELRVPCVCGHRLGRHTDTRCAVCARPCRFVPACPCMSCCHGTHPGYRTLAEEAHGLARWNAFGCITAPHEHGKELLVRYFAKFRFSRGAAWDAVVEVDGGQYWRKCHTARTWAWYVVLQ